jgi:hypothetical protein
VIETVLARRDVVGREPFRVIVDDDLHKIFAG